MKRNSYADNGLGVDNKPVLRERGHARDANSCVSTESHSVETASTRLVLIKRLIEQVIIKRAF